MGLLSPERFGFEMTVNLFRSNTNNKDWEGLPVVVHPFVQPLV